MTLLKVNEALKLLGANWNLQRLYAAIRDEVFPLGVVMSVGQKSIRFDEDRLKTWIATQEQFISAAEAATVLRCGLQLIYFNADPANGVFPQEIVRRKNRRLLIDKQGLEMWILNGGNYKDGTPLPIPITASSNEAIH